MKIIETQAVLEVTEEELRAMGRTWLYTDESDTFNPVEYAIYEKDTVTKHLCESLGHPDMVGSGGNFLRKLHSAINNLDVKYLKVLCEDKTLDFSIAIK